MRSLEAQDLVFRARALAQAHPLSPLVNRFVNRAVHQEQSYQSLPDVGIWAGAALVDGYCLRRVEEQEEPTPAPPSSSEVAPADLDPADLDPADLDPIDLDPIDRLDEAASHIASDLRAGLSGDAA
ncbi:MAG: hypothetical protein M3137_12315, partial [Actinomycetota bacterium]|nr:hypothetical protein [Actinomycetota bacterium]